MEALNIQFIFGLYIYINKTGERQNRFCSCVLLSTHYVIMSLLSGLPVLYHLALFFCFSFVLRGLLVQTSTCVCIKSLVSRKVQPSMYNSAKSSSKRAFINTLSFNYIWLWDWISWQFKVSTYADESIRVEPLKLHHMQLFFSAPDIGLFPKFGITVCQHRKPKMIILSLFTHPHVHPNPSDFLRLRNPKITLSKQHWIFSFVPQNKEMCIALNDIRVRNWWYNVYFFWVNHPFKAVS